MPKINRNEVRVGVFILIPLAIVLILTLFKLGYSIAGSTLDVYLKVDSIKSIKKGTLIKIRGYTIGRVVEIKPVFKPALHFLATMRIDRSIELYEDCTAKIMNQNIIGDTIIQLINPLKKGPPLQDQDVIEGLEIINLETTLQDVHHVLTAMTSTVEVFKQISLESRYNLRTLLADLSNSVSTINQILASSQKDVIAIMASFRKTAKTMDEISTELKKHPVKFLFKDEDD